MRIQVPRPSSSPGLRDRIASGSPRVCEPLWRGNSAKVAQRGAHGGQVSDFRAARSPLVLKVNSMAWLY